MFDIDTLFDKIGGSGKMADALGVKPSAASEMKRRGSIPVRYWPKLIAICAMRDIEGVTYETLAKLASRISPTAPSRAASADQVPHDQS